MDSLRYVFSSKCTYSWFIGMFLHNSKLGSITLFGPLHSVPNFCLFRLLAKPRQAMSVYTPVKHRPEWYWKEVFERRGIEAPGSSGYEDGSGVVVGGRKPTGQKILGKLQIWSYSRKCVSFLLLCACTWYVYMYVHLIWSYMYYGDLQHEAVCFGPFNGNSSFGGHPAGCLAWHPLQPRTERGVGMSGSQWTLLGPSRGVWEETTVFFSGRMGEV